MKIEMATPMAYVIDTDGLRKIASASGNVRAVLIQRLESGEIAVPICVWHEFKEIYPDYASDIENSITNRIRMNKAYFVGAASIAERLNSGFPRGPYDDNVEMLTASIADCHGCSILTSKDQVSVYAAMGSVVMDIEDLVH